MKRKTVEHRGVSRAQSGWPVIGSNKYLKSPLEVYAYKRLTEEELDFEYEGKQFTLTPSFSYPHWGRGAASKVFKYHPNNRSIKYTPDFLGANWAIETKGMLTQEFSKTWKMFKKHLLDNNLDWFLAMPRNKKEVDLSIIKLKEWLENGHDQ